MVIEFVLINHNYDGVDLHWVLFNLGFVPRLHLSLKINVAVFELETLKYRRIILLDKIILRF